MRWQCILHGLVCGHHTFFFLSLFVSEPDGYQLGLSLRAGFVMTFFPFEGIVPCACRRASNVVVVGCENNKNV